MPAFFETGFSVREPMWHGLGEVLETHPDNWDDARVVAGLDWEPCYKDIFTARPYPPDTKIEDLPDGSILMSVAGNGNLIVHEPVEGHRAIARDDTQEVLAVPTSTYQLIYHSQMGELLEAYLEAWGKLGAKVNFETAGSLKGGRMVWALAWVDEPYQIPGDDSPIYPYVALLNYHDGTGACQLLPTQVRIVCWNTWKMAEAGESRAGGMDRVVLRHTANVADRIEEAKTGLTMMRAEAERWQEVATGLANINVDDAVVRTFLDEFIPIPENATSRVVDDRTQRRGVFMGLYENSPTTDGIRGTAYGLVQTAGEYLDHLRPYRSADTYMSRTMFKTEPVKSAAVKLVMELAEAGSN